MSEFRVLVVAKAPVAGQVKTRLCERHSPLDAAVIAAASLRDTLRYCEQAVGVGNCHLALAGDLTLAEDGAQIAKRIARWQVHPQVGDTFGDRLAHAHRSVGAGAPVVQIGMDTPQLSARDLDRVAAQLQGHDAVVAPAVDGGWWALGLHDGSVADVLRQVPMSTPHTGTDTVQALESRGLRVAHGHVHRDLDWHEDAELIAADAPETLFARRWRAIVREPVAIPTRL